MTALLLLLLLLLPAHWSPAALLRLCLNLIFLFLFCLAAQVGTKVVYFFPRFVVVNLLERPLALNQPEPRTWRSGVAAAPARDRAAEVT